MIVIEFFDHDMKLPVSYGYIPIALGRYCPLGLAHAETILDILCGDIVIGL